MKPHKTLLFFTFAILSIYHVHIYSAAALDGNGPYELASLIPAHNGICAPSDHNCGDDALVAVATNNNDQVANLYRNGTIILRDIVRGTTKELKLDLMSKTRKISEYGSAFLLDNGNVIVPINDSDHLLPVSESLELFNIETSSTTVLVPGAQCNNPKICEFPNNNIAIALSYAPRDITKHWRLTRKNPVDSQLLIFDPRGVCLQQIMLEDICSAPCALQIAPDATIILDHEKGFKTINPQHFSAKHFPKTTGQKIVWWTSPAIAAVAGMAIVKAKFFSK